MHMHSVPQVGTLIEDPYVKCGCNSLSMRDLKSLGMVRKHQRASLALPSPPSIGRHEVLRSLHRALRAPGRLPGGGPDRATPVKRMHLRW